MSSEYEVRVSKIGGSLRVTIPVELTRAFGIRPGETLLATLNEKGILFRRLDTTVPAEKIHCPECGKRLSPQDLSRSPAGGLLLRCPFCHHNAQVEKFGGT